MANKHIKLYKQPVDPKRYESIEALLSRDDFNDNDVRYLIDTGKLVFDDYKAINESTQDGEDSECLESFYLDYYTKHITPDSFSVIGCSNKHPLIIRTDSCMAIFTDPVQASNRFMDLVKKEHKEMLGEGCCISIPEYWYHVNIPKIKGKIPEWATNKFLPYDDPAYASIKKIKYNTYSKFVVSVQGVQHEFHLNYDGYYAETIFGQSSEQIDRAMNLANRIRSHLEETLGFPKPSVCQSKYGIDLLYPADIAYSGEAEFLVKQSLDCLAKMFDNYDAFIVTDKYSVKRQVPIYGSLTKHDSDIAECLRELGYPEGTGVIHVEAETDKKVSLKDLVRFIMYRDVSNYRMP